MKELGSGTVFLSSHKKGQSFEESVASFIRAATQEIQRKVSEDELYDHNQRLAELYGEGVSFLYFTRKHRDEALGAAYQLYPRKTVNSDEQVALARAAASKEIRLHTLIKESLEAIKFRKQVNTQKLGERQMER